MKNKITKQTECEWKKIEDSMYQIASSCSFLKESVSGDFLLETEYSYLSDVMRNIFENFEKIKKIHSGDMKLRIKIETEYSKAIFNS